MLAAFAALDAAAGVAFVDSIIVCACSCGYGSKGGKVLLLAEESAAEAPV